ncbi:unnamed protein product [Colias eurytheme]|nr:unnamed protein product [Colias eurytheme]
MTSLQTEEACQNIDPNNTLPMDVESSLRFPIDNSMRIIFTGYYNGYGVEVRGIEEMAMLYHMGCFGKGTKSRSRPKSIKNDGSPCIMRKRQYLKRNYWYKKFSSSQPAPQADDFLINVKSLTSKILHDSAQRANKDVIDLVSSDDEPCDTDQSDNYDDTTCSNEKKETVVIVPNSDSEDDNYFANLKPKCCLNKIQLEEKLMLTKQEAFFLLYGLGCLQIFNIDNKLLKVNDCWKLFNEADHYFMNKYIVYHYYRSKGYIVKPGIKFGGDFLIYREGPGINHSDYIVVIKQKQESQDWLTMLGHVRMAATTVKEIIIIEIIEPSKENITLPKDLSEYTVKEIILTRNIPVVINNDED